MNSLQSGNLSTQNPGGAKLNGWFIGQFMEKDSPFHSDEVEVKWSVFHKGEVYDVVRASGHAKSVAILIQGNVQMIFPDSNKTIVLTKEGDFVFWGSGVFHQTKIVEDSIVLTIRWPSIPNDVMTK